MSKPVRKAASYEVPKGEKVIGALPSEFLRVKVLLRAETFRNHGGGSRWATTRMAEPIIVNNVTMEDVERAIADALNALVAARASA